MGYNFREQLKAIYDNLVENVAWRWKNRYRDQYMGLAEHQIVATRTTTSGNSYTESTTMPTGDVTHDTTGATISQVAFTESSISKLTQGILDKVYLQMVREGAGNNPMGRENGKPVFTLITSPEASDKIIREDGVRDDYRYSPQVSELLKPLGVERSYRGFYHLVDPFPKRWSYDATGTGAWTEVAPYINTGTAATSWTGKQGSNARYIINPDYEAAEYEDSIVFHTDVFESLIPAPMSNAGSGVKFNPLTYRGKFDFLNIRDRVENPDGSWGFFRGVLANAAKPIKPQYGYVIRHKRCDPVDFRDCAGTNITAAG
jgi:hypothetical protein